MNITGVALCVTAYLSLLKIQTTRTQRTAVYVIFTWLISMIRYYKKGLPPSLQEWAGGYGKLPDGLYPDVDPDLDTEGTGSPEVMQGPDELRSCGKGRSHKRRIKSMAKALYKLKTSDVREMINAVLSGDMSQIKVCTHDTYL